MAPHDVGGDDDHEGQHDLLRVSQRGERQTRRGAAAVGRGLDGLENEPNGQRDQEQGRALRQQLADARDRKQRTRRAEDEGDRGLRLSWVTRQAMRQMKTSAAAKITACAA